MWRRVGGIALSVVMAVAVVGVSGGVATARQADSDSEGRGYLALGDSVTFGFSPLLEDPWIPSRFVGYPEIIERRTETTTTNLGCPGQTAQALVSLHAVDNGCFRARRQARRAGFVLLHTDYRGRNSAPRSRQCDRTRHRR